jgi:superfamily II DNA or RNA helicase
MINPPLFFDEFDIKENATTDTLKRGKKAFQKNLIQQVSYTADCLQGVYCRGDVQKKVKIVKQESALVGSVDDKIVKPFSVPLTALAYWYIYYINNHASKNPMESDEDASLEPHSEIKLIMRCLFPQNKVNLTLYQPKTNAYCNESHLFVHSFQQLIMHFEPRAKAIIQKLAYRFDDTFFYNSHWERADQFLCTHIIELIQLNALYNERHQKIEIKSSPIHLKVMCVIINHRILISFLWTDGTSEMSVVDVLQCETSNYVVYKNSCYRIKNPMHSKIAFQFKDKSFQRLNILKIKPFIKKMVELKKKVGIELRIDANIQKLQPVTIEPVCTVDVFPTPTGGRLMLSVAYGDVHIRPSNPTDYIIFDDYTFTQRNFDLEQQFRDALLHCHPSSTKDDTMDFDSPYFDQVLGLIKTKQLDSVRLTEASNRAIRSSKGVIQPFLQFKGSGRFLVPNIHWRLPSNEKVTAKLMPHIQHQLNFYFDAKSAKVIPIEKSQVLERLLQPEVPGIPIGVGIYLALNTPNVELPADAREIVSELKKDVTLDADSDRILRPFQKEGVAWLLRLINTRMNGILADDMGLGKTIQTIMLLNTVQTKKTPPAVVILPKTLLFNWKRELQTFAPNLKVLVYDGPKRRLLVPSFGEYNVILVSYTTVRLDMKWFSAVEFNFKVLDEAQYIKNHTTSTFKAVKKIKARHVLLLTGTPLENHVGDLWSLMEIANPNYFGPYAGFESFYAVPANQFLLKAAMHPFMLRRRKTDVLRDLPAVSVQELWATPTPEEIRWYTKFATKEWEFIEQIVLKKGLEKSKVHIFALMTKLRQWCAHPGLVTEGVTDGPKWAVFYDRLHEAIANGHKVVIFSQFIPMIKIMQDKLNEDGIDVVCLTGQTKNREQVIETFNTNPNIRVGIFSLKAGGVGINLTSADYVFLYDPWWNPAVEQQAIDRVHRMGQDRPVMVFKCLVASTIEERMINHQNQKNNLIQSLVEEQSIKDLNVTQIKALIGI